MPSMKRYIAHISTQTWFMLGMSLVLLLFFAGTVLFLSQNHEVTEERVAKIVEDPRSFYGKGVSLSGNIGEYISSRAFTIESPGFVGGSLLVLSKKPLQPVGGGGLDEYFFKTNEKVEIQGRVEFFDLSKAEQELGVDLIDAAFLTWEGRPVIIAEDVSENK